MNKYAFLLLIFASFSCSDDEDDDDAGNWVKVSDFEGVTRSGSVSFTIDNFAYVGLGYDGDEYVNDFWRYDPDLNFWQEVASFPGTGRISAVAFSADGKGYVTTGFNGDVEVEELGDTWEYDPATNEWTEKAPFGGGARYSAVAFSINGLGYVGTGYDGNYLKDFWSYDPINDAWTQRVSLFGSKREGATAFVIAGVAYVGAGRNNGQFLNDFWSFVPESDVWNDLTSNDEEDNYDEYIDALNRYDAVSFVLDGIAYITTGLSTSYLSSVYSYDPITDLWETSLTDFEGVSRANAVAFVLNNRAFVATGRSSSQRHDDIWEFLPLEEYDEFD